MVKFILFVGSWVGTLSLSFLLDGRLPGIYLGAQWYHVVSEITSKNLAVAHYWLLG